VTEAEWLEATVPRQMFGFIRGRLSLRKRQLFDVECFRHLVHLLRYPEQRAAIEFLEEVDEGRGTREDRRRIARGTKYVLNGPLNAPYAVDLMLYRACLTSMGWFP
jgi:hypothetical protein